MCSQMFRRIINIIMAVTGPIVSGITYEKHCPRLFDIVFTTSIEWFLFQKRHTAFSQGCHTWLLDLSVSSIHSSLSCTPKINKGEMQSVWHHSSAATNILLRRKHNKWPNHIPKCQWNHKNALHGWHQWIAVQFSALGIQSLRYCAWHWQWDAVNDHLWFQAASAFAKASQPSPLGESTLVEDTWHLPVPILHRSTPPLPFCFHFLFRMITCWNLPQTTHHHHPSWGELIVLLTNWNEKQTTWIEHQFENVKVLAHSKCNIIALFMV